MFMLQMKVMQYTNYVVLWKMHKNPLHSSWIYTSHNTNGSDLASQLAGDQELLL